MPLATDDLVQEIMGQPMRRAGRFIKMVCSGALACLKQLPPEAKKGKKTGIFLATGLGNGDEILPFVTQVFKHSGGFPSPNQFANSVSNAAAFFLARHGDVKGVVLTLSDEELSFESALWLAQSYLEKGEIDLALVGGCDVYTPTIEEYRERMNVSPGNSRPLPIGEGSSWLLLGRNNDASIGTVLSVTFDHSASTQKESLPLQNTFSQCEEMIACVPDRPNQSKIFLPGFRLNKGEDDLFRSRGWDVDDYLPQCGIHPTAAAYGIARALHSGRSGIFVHCNRNTSGRQALVAAMTK